MQVIGMKVIQVSAYQHMNRKRYFATCEVVRNTNQYTMTGAFGGSRIAAINNCKAYAALVAAKPL